MIRAGELLVAAQESGSPLVGGEDRHQEKQNNPTQTQPDLDFGPFRLQESHEVGEVYRIKVGILIYRCLEP